MMSATVNISVVFFHCVVYMLEFLYPRLMCHINNEKEPVNEQSEHFLSDLYSLTSKDR